MHFITLCINVHADYKITGVWQCKEQNHLAYIMEKFSIDLAYYILETKRRFGERSGIIQIVITAY